MNVWKLDGPTMEGNSCKCFDFFCLEAGGEEPEEPEGGLEGSEGGPEEEGLWLNILLLFMMPSSFIQICHLFMAIKLDADLKKFLL